jgi:hypothetical protein
MRRSQPASVPRSTPPKAGSSDPSSKEMASVERFTTESYSAEGGPPGGFAGAGLFLASG